MTYGYILGIENESVKEKLNSEQFRLSEIIMDKRFELDLSIDEMAEIIKETPEEYLNLEYGEVNISIEKFRKAIKAINLYELQQRPFSVSESNDPSSFSFSRTQEVEISWEQKFESSDKYEHKGELGVWLLQAA